MKYLFMIHNNESFISKNVNCIKDAFYELATEYECQSDKERDSDIIKNKDNFTTKQLIRIIYAFYGEKIESIYELGECIYDS